MLCCPAAAGDAADRGGCTPGALAVPPRPARFCGRVDVGGPPGGRHRASPFGRGRANPKVVPLGGRGARSAQCVGATGGGDTGPAPPGRRGTAACRLAGWPRGRRSQRLWLPVGWQTCVKAAQRIGGRQYLGARQPAGTARAPPAATAPSANARSFRSNQRGRVRPAEYAGEVTKPQQRYGSRHRPRSSAPRLTAVAVAQAQYPQFHSTRTSRRGGRPRPLPAAAADRRQSASSGNTTSTPGSS